MPLIPYTPQPVIVEVSDRIPGVLKQKAHVVDYDFKDASRTQSGPTLHVELEVSLYADVNGTYGPEQKGAGLMPYSVFLKADNFCAVTPAGEIRYLAFENPADPTQNESLQAFADRLNTLDELLVLQGNWFEDIMNTQPAYVAPMLRAFILQADQPPFSKFAQALAP
jgi:hypothetical protein